MKKLIIYSIFILISSLLKVGVGNANNDYVCTTNLNTGCQGINWETSFRSDGKLHGFGKKGSYTIIGNTRVGCPSSIQNGQLTDEFNLYKGTVMDNGGFRYGYINNNISGKEEDCEVTKTDNIAPIVNVTQSADIKTKQGDIRGYSGNFVESGSTISILCNNNNGSSHPECTPIYSEIKYYTYTATCSDTGFFNDETTNTFGNSGCEVDSSTPQDINVKGTHTFRMYDNAGNEGSVTQIGGGGITTGSIVTCLTNSTCYTPDLPTSEHQCFDDGNPVGDLSYSTEKCTNQNVIVTPNCTGDTGLPKVCGCVDSNGGSLPEKVGANQSSDIGIFDNAWRMTKLPYTIDYIDKTIPQIKYEVGNQKALSDNFFLLSAYDEKLGGCSDDLHYKLTITGPESKVIEGTITKNTEGKSITLGLTKIGTYSFIIEVWDEAGNIVKENSNDITIYPGDLDKSKSYIQDITTPGDKYANNSDYYEYKLTLRDKFDNPIYGKSISNLTQDGDTTRINMGEGDKGVIEYDYDSNTDPNGNTTFKIKSLAPGTFDQSFLVEMSHWNGSYIDDDTTKDQFKFSINGPKSFKKPFVGELEVSDDDGKNWDGKPNFGTLILYRLKVVEKSNLTNFKLDNFKDEILPIGKDLIIQRKSILDNLNESFIKFESRINTDKNVNISDKTPGIKLDLPIISYTLGGELVKYNLSSKDDAGDLTPISLTGSKFLGINILGTLQGEGKQRLTGQDTNFSDLSKVQARTQIRRNAYENIKSMTSGYIVKGVKYVEGDIKISGDNLGYETLVVKDGNVIIEGNLTNERPLGIIVLKDGYDIKKDYDGKGNVYITPGVAKINAVIYADGGLISSDSNGDPYIYDTSERTSDLQNQLVFNGSIFTKNTIGGAILGKTKMYKLPGGTETDKFYEAMIYDLNYIRRGNKGCDKKDGECINKDAFIIKYNSFIQTNPPKLFK